MGTTNPHQYHTIAKTCEMDLPLRTTCHNSWIGTGAPPARRSTTTHKSGTSRNRRNNSDTACRNNSKEFCRIKRGRPKIDTAITRATERKFKHHLVNGSRSPMWNLQRNSKMECAPTARCSTKLANLEMFWRSFMLSMLRRPDAERLLHPAARTAPNTLNIGIDKILIE